MNFKKYLEETNEHKTLENCLKNNGKVCASGLGIGERIFLLSNVSKKMLYIAMNVAGALKIQKQFQSLGKKCVVVTELNMPVLSDINSCENLDLLNNGLSKIFCSDYDVLIILGAVLFQKLPQKKDYLKNSVFIKKGQSINRDELISLLIRIKYKRTEIIENIGDFVVRGDILTINSVNHEDMIRIEFWGDEVDNIFTINKVDGQVLKKFDDVLICPNTLIFGNKDEIDMNSIGEVLQEKLLSNNEEYFGDGDYLFTPFLSNLNCNILDWFENELVVVEESNWQYENIIQVEQELGKEMAHCEDEFKIKNYKYFIDIKKVLYFERCKNIVSFDNISMKCPLFLNKNKINFACMNLGNFSGNLQTLFEDIKFLIQQGLKIFVCIKANEEKKKVEFLLNNNGFSFTDDLTKIKDKNIIILSNNIAYNVCLLNEKIAIISSYNKNYKSDEASKMQNFYLPGVNEYVVHQKHGIGLCKDVLKLNFGISEKDYFVIEYAKGDILYLPTEHTEELSRYVGGEKPVLNILGGEQFAKAKERVKSAVKQIAFDLKMLYAERQNQKGVKYDIDNELIKQFENSFPYDLTVDQEQAMKDIYNDMSVGKVMDRLICGDVGFGKTELAMRAAFATIISGRQVAILVPTTILCHQHFHTAQNRMKDYGIRIGMLSRLNTPTENKKIAQELKDGKYDLICGTHKMLSKEISFANLGLLVLDEEQRFGVGDKEKIKNIKKNINVLTLSATPIPRTLHLSLIGVRDVSLLSTPPNNRIAVQNIVCEYSDEMLVTACIKELDRDGQVLIISNRVVGMTTLVEKVKRLMPDAIVDYVHGQMPSQRLENSIIQMYEKQTQILIATTLIENGIDLPSANTLIILNADNMGLSQLYQLRGRVGRSGRNAFAYFTYTKQKVLSEIAYKRLDTLREFGELGSGFKVAMRDLELRGAGNILGAEQHGHIDKIGYDMYCKILAETVAEAQGQINKPKVSTKIECNLPAHLPTNYIANEGQRIKIYNLISQINSQKYFDDLYEKIRQEYGILPIETVELMFIGFIKNLAQEIGITTIIIRNTGSYMEFCDNSVLQNEKMAKIFMKYNDIFQLSNVNDKKLQISDEYTSFQKQENILKLLKEISKL